MASGISKKRYRLLNLAVAAVFPLLIYQIIHLTIHSQDFFVEKANRQQNLFVQIPSERGAILDRNLKVFATNLKAPSITAVPRLIKLKERPKLVQELSQILDLPPSFLVERLSRDKAFVWLKRHASKGEANAVRSLNNSNLNIIDEPKRFYPNGKMLSNVLGFCDIDNVGVEGLELLYDRKLKGQHGFRRTKRDGLLREVVALEEKLVPAVNGADVVLTIDQYIQFLTDQALDRAFEERKAKSAIAVVMNPKTGEILAMSSRPTFDPNDRTQSDIAHRRNRPITDIFEPGSVFKIVTAAAALNEGVVTESDHFDCEQGEWRARPSRIIHDVHPYGILSFSEVLIKSSNIGTVKIAKRLGEKKLYEYIKRFGFGEKTMIDFPGEVSGILRPPHKWSKYSITSIPFGQEVAATAIQMLSAISAIANRGYLVRPYLLKEIRDERGVTLYKKDPTILHSVITPEVSATMRSILERVVNEGTGKRARIDGVRVAGKTGTSQKLDPNGGYSHSHFIGSFIGFAPAEDPMLAMIVSIDDPKPYYYGGTVAAPVFQEVIEASLIHLGYVPEEKKREASKVLIYSRGERPLTGESVLADSPQIRKSPQRGVQGVSPLVP